MTKDKLIVRILGGLLALAGAVDILARWQGWKWSWTEWVIAIGLIAFMAASYWTKRQERHS